MWRSLLQVMEAHGYSNITFKGFMADSAQANFNAVRIVFGSGDPKIPMENRERTCQFHWKMALERHTKQLIKPELQARHIGSARSIGTALLLQKQMLQRLQFVRGGTLLVV